MRGQRDICLFCRHNLTSSAPFRSAQRCYSNRSANTPRPYEPFVLPRAVIDLDAADSKFVRSFEDLPKNEQQRRLQWRPNMLSNALKRRKKSKSQRFGAHAAGSRRELRDTAPEKTPLDSFSISLQNAFLDEPVTQSTDDLRLLDTFRRRIIQASDDSMAKTQQLPQYHTPNSYQTPSPTNFVESHYHLRNCTDFQELSRTLTSFSSTKKGCHFLVLEGKNILNQIRRFRKQGAMSKGNNSQASVSMATELVNHLAQNIMFYGLDIGQGICSAGLYYASKVSNFPLMKVYLEIWMKYGYGIDKRFTDALRNLQLAYAKDSTTVKSWTVRNEDQDGRAELLKLLVGQSPNEPSMVGVIRKDRGDNRGPGKSLTKIATYSTYVAGMGEMQLSDALWKEWQMSDAVLLEPSLKEGTDPGYIKRFRTQLFALAFVLAKDSDRALEVLKTVPVGDEPTHLSRRLRSQILEHYNFHRLQPTKTLQQKIGEWIMPVEPALALEVLETLLLTDYPKYEAEQTLKVDWAKRGKDFGLLVRGAGVEPIYFKPAGTRAQGRIQ